MTNVNYEAVDVEATCLKLRKGMVGGCVLGYCRVEVQFLDLIAPFLEKEKVK